MPSDAIQLPYRLLPGERHLERMWAQSRDDRYGVESLADETHASHASFHAAFW